MEQIKITHKLDYEEAEAAAQGCWDDCTVVSYTNTDNGNVVKPVGAPAISVNTCRSKKVTNKTPKTNPFL